MTRAEAAEKALNESVRGIWDDPEIEQAYPFWNAAAIQFMYAPSFQFQKIPGCSLYRFHLRDSTGRVCQFESNTPYACLAPVWRELAEGVVTLGAEAAAEQNSVPVGARTFMKLASFPADTSGAACSYTACVERAYRYFFNSGFIRCWLENGMPDPAYDWYVYPSKMIAAIIRSMTGYAKTEPSMAEPALTVARRAADYLIGISFGKGTPLEGLPPTYYIDFRPEPEKQRNLTAANRKHSLMMTYPAAVGSAYLTLAGITGEDKYRCAAEKIGCFYRDHILPNGSWPLVISVKTGERLTRNECAPMHTVVPFLTDLYEKTGETAWETLAERAVGYTEREMLSRYDWEAQFEDSTLSVNHSNLTHYEAGALARYYAHNFPRDERKMRCARQLTRFIEDQFVIWESPAPWAVSGFPTEKWYTPCGLEQYTWYVPIDASTADITRTFYKMYLATKDELYLHKAKALADQITRMQQPDGCIPTHWTDDRHVKEHENLWINCMASTMEVLTEMKEEEGIK